MNPIKNNWTILAQSSAVDQTKNSLSIFDIVEEITIQIGGQLPDQFVFPVNMMLVSLWERDKMGESADLKLRIRLKDPKDEILFNNEASLHMDPHHKRSRLLVQLQGMPVRGEGTYLYEIVSMEPEKTGGKELVASVSVQVKILVQSPITVNNVKSDT